MAQASKKITIPNANVTAQEFQVDIKSVSINISVQTDERLVSNPGKATEKAVQLNPYANTNLQINIALAKPEDLAKALTDHPLLAPVLALVEAEVIKKFA